MKVFDILRFKKYGKYIILKSKTDINYNAVEYREIFGLSMAQKVNNQLVNDSFFENIPTMEKDLTVDKKEDLILPL